MDFAQLAAFYKNTLLEDVLPFWQKHGLDPIHGGIITALDRDGSVLDTDKSVWFQGRSGWLFSTLYSSVERRAEWLEAARSCIHFLRSHCVSPTGKLYFTVTREGLPLRMRRYVYSEAFASLANAAYAKASGDSRAAEDAFRMFSDYLRHSFTPGLIPAKVEPATRPTKSLGAFMIGIFVAQELRSSFGESEVGGRTLTDWIDGLIDEIDRCFNKPELKVVMETVGPTGEIIDHFDGRTLNPGHAIETAWFIMSEGRLREEARLIEMGCRMLDWMLERGWDLDHGGISYFRDLYGLPVQEYWHDMKFWWPHNEAIIASLLAFRLSGDRKYAEWHRRVHDWSFAHFPDPEFGEWYGYLHRDGTPSVKLKGNMWKGPFHLPRMLLKCWELCEERAPRSASRPVR